MPSLALTLPDPDQSPPWVDEYLRAAVVLLGLHDWRIRVKMRDHPHDDDEADGCAATSARYHEADVQLKRTLLPDPYGRAVLMHELLEVRTAEMDLAVRRIIELLPPDQRAFALDLWRDAAEKTIELTARSLAAHLDDVRDRRKSRKKGEAAGPPTYVGASIENGLPPRPSILDLW